MLSKPKNKKLAILLALGGVVLPISGFHKFYLGQPGWGVAYLLLSMTPMPRIASAIEALWYLVQGQQEFDINFNNGVPSVQPPVDPDHVGAIAESLRQLDQLRQDGLLSDYEFEQKRRQLLDRIS